MRPCALYVRGKVISRLAETPDIGVGASTHTRCTSSLGEQGGVKRKEAPNAGPFRETFGYLALRGGEAHLRKKIEFLLDCEIST